MNDELFLEMAKQAPIAFVLGACMLAIVWMFLKFMRGAIDDLVHTIGEFQKQNAEEHHKITGALGETNLSLSEINLQMKQRRRGDADGRTVM